MTTLDGAWTYQYDPDGQLTHAVFSSSNTSVVPNQDLQYVYDLAGNRTETIINGVTTAYVSNNMNQYTQIGSATLTYDADGNLIAQTDGTGTTTYAYDELNRLIGVSSPTDTSAYQYDPLGNLASMTQNAQTTHYVVDPIGLGNVVGEYSGSGGLIANYTYGLGLTSRVDVGGQPSYYDFDRSAPRWASPGLRAPIRISIVTCRSARRSPRPGRSRIRSSLLANSVSWHRQTGWTS